MRNARTDFLRFYLSQLYTRDCDPGIYGLKYLCERQELNREQRYWICFLYAVTYNVPQAWIFFNEYPDLKYADLTRMKHWEALNFKRFHYQKDQKWHKGHLAATVASYRSVTLDGLQEFFWQPKDFTAAWKAAISIHKWGRYTTWMFLQALREVCGCYLEPDSLELWHKSSKQHRDGLMRVLDCAPWVGRGPEEFNSEVRAYFDTAAVNLLTDAELAWTEAWKGSPEQRAKLIQPDYFNLETALCAFSKLFRRERGRYLGYYLDRWADDITLCSGLEWSGINWDLLWECREEGLPPELCRRDGVHAHQDQFNLYLDTGEFMPESPLRDKLNHLFTCPM